MLGHAGDTMADLLPEASIPVYVDEGREHVVHEETNEYSAYQEETNSVKKVQEAKFSLFHSFFSLRQH